MSMGESTRRRLEGVVRAANAGGAPGAPAQYVGGWQGGLGGTWGKAARGLDGKPDSTNTAPGPVRPASAGRTRSGAGPAAASPAPHVFSGAGVAAAMSPGPTKFNPSYGSPSSTHQHAGVRERIRPASAGAKNLWNEMNRDLPKAPPHALTSGKVRPASATHAKASRPTAGINTVEYKVQGMSLEPAKTAGGVSGGGGGGGMRSSNSFGTPPPVSGRPGSSRTYNSPVMDASRHELARIRAAEATDAGPSVITEAYIATLEDAIRDALRARRTVYEGSQELLLRLFKAVDDGSGDVDCNEFIGVCAQIGVSVSPAEAQALFRRFGYDTVMPFEPFAHTLIMQPARQLAQDMPVRKGAFTPGTSANFNGKILYRYCRKPVYTPSDWDPALADRSADMPMARLVIEFVYGYQGVENTSQNLFYTADGKIVYYVAGVGVVYHRPPVHHQHFFLAHTDDISSLAICPAAVDVNGRQHPGRTLIATGQVTSVDEGPFVSIWDSRACSSPADGAATVAELVRLKFDKDARGIVALGFNATGTRLVAVAMDNQHSVYVYDWRKQRVVHTGKGQMGDPPQVYGIEWNPYEVSHGATPAFLTFGRKHMKVWTGDASGTNWQSKQMSFGKLPMQNVTSAQWLPPRPGQESLIVAGVADGSLYIIKGSAAIKSIAAHRPGPQIIQATGHPSHDGVRGLRVCKNGTVLLSGGADGTVLQWDVSDGTLAESRFAGPSMQLKSPFGPGDKWAPRIRALDYSPELDRIIVGTNHCDIQELTPTTDETLMDGHSGDVHQLSFHPTKPNILATCSDSGHVHLWDTSTRTMTHCAAVGLIPRCVQYSTAPIPSTGSYHLAVGSSKGAIKVLDEGANLRPLHDVKDSKEGIMDLKYSPDARFLAAATADTWVDIYNVDRGYARVARCTGHSSTVRGLDWSTDSSMIQTASADLELLTWNARTGKQITMPVRDVEWATYTVNQGFPVMGIWPDSADGTDINSADRSKGRKFLVTADDSGLVKLFNYPVVVEDAPHRAYRGHSSHVLGVRFNANDTTVCSVGGRDWAIFQFRLVHLDPTAPAPAPPKPVWGALDPQGRAFGFTTNPVPLAEDAAASGSGPSASYIPPQAEQGSGYAQRGVSPPRGLPPHMAGIPEEASLGGASFAADEGLGEEEEDLGPRLARNAAPTRMHADDDSISLGGGFSQDV